MEATASRSRMSSWYRMKWIFVQMRVNTEALRTLEDHFSQSLERSSTAKPNGLGASSAMSQLRV
jgi:hypothetical protein